jgi:hypoxanthine phosphoribosyltransferase
MQASSFPSPNNDPNGLMRDISRVLFTQEEIQQRIGELGKQISSDYADLNPLFVGVLKGVVFFMSDLMRAITIPARMDFMAISRYAPHGQAKGPVRLIKDLEETVDGQHVIFVEDVIDTGLTLNYLLRILKTRSPASLEVCALFDKKEHRLINTPVRYCGFDLPSRFVVGYGLDYCEGYRHLPFVGELRPELLNLA